MVVAEQPKAREPSPPLPLARPAEITVKGKSEEKQSEPTDGGKTPAAPVLTTNAFPKCAIVQPSEVQADATPVPPASEQVATEKSSGTNPASRDSSGETPPANKSLPTPITAPAQEKAVAKPAPDQVALLKKPVEPMIESKPLVRPMPKALEGFVIQLAFNDKNKARSWAEKMEQRGYAVSVTEAGAEGALRVRLGNFSIRDEAERQLQDFKKDGMRGIIINLPQAFRPEARSSIP
jgi:cell division protein FtsN